MSTPIQSQFLPSSPRETSSNQALPSQAPPPFLRNQPGDRQTQSASFLFCLPSEIVAGVGEQIFARSLIAQGTQWNELGKAISLVALTCKAGYSLALNFSAKLRPDERELHVEHQLFQLTMYSSRPIHIPHVLKLAVQFIHTQAPDTPIPANHLPTGHGLLTDLTLVATLPKIHIPVDTKNHAEACEALRVQLQLSRHQRSSITIALKEFSAPGFDLDGLIEHCNTHGEVLIELDKSAPASPTPQLIKLVEKGLLRTIRLDVPANSPHLGALLKAIQSSTALKHIWLNAIDQAADQDQVMQALGNSSIESIFIVQDLAKTPVPSPAISHFIETHKPLKRFRIMGTPTQKPGDLSEQAITDLKRFYKALALRKELNPQEFYSQVFKLPSLPKEASVMKQ